MSVTIDMGEVDVHFADIAEQVVENCEEADLLISLAIEEERLTGEGKFAVEAARRLRELAQWFKVNQP